MNFPNIGDLQGLDYSIIPPNFVTHFEPMPEFLEWLVDYIDDRFAIEVGAGQCLFTRELIRLGVRTLAIEPRANPQVLEECASFLLPLPVNRVEMLREYPAVVISARPDHSGWFRTVRDLIHPDSTLLYIGLEKNLDQDIPETQTITELYRGAGYDDEVVWKVT